MYDDQDITKERFRLAAEREKEQQSQREKLRDFAAQLREAQDMAPGTASFSNPTFLIGPAKDFPGVIEGGKVGDTGHLGPASFKEVADNLRSAAQRSDVTSRDADVSRAAKVVAKEWLHKHNHHQHNESPGSALLREGRAQVAFATSELAAAAGLNSVESKMVGHAMERALEKEGFKVIASQAVDKIAHGIESWRASSAGAALASGNRHAAENTLSKSLDWLASKGVSSEALKDAIGKHTGKFQIIATAASHPETVQAIAQTIARSDGLINGVLAISKDDELRKAIGTMTIAAGESLSSVTKAGGSIAIVAGSAMKGESAEDMGRHVFRAGMSILGGAAGGVAVGSVSAGMGAVAGAVAGQAAGSALADKILKVYDEYMGNSQTKPMAATQVKDFNQSKEVLIDRAEKAGAHKLEGDPQLKSALTSTVAAAQAGRERG